MKFKKEIVLVAALLSFCASGQALATKPALTGAETQQISLTASKRATTAFTMGLAQGENYTQIVTEAIDAGIPIAEIIGAANQQGATLTEIFQGALAASAAPPEEVVVQMIENLIQGKVDLESIAWSAKYAGVSEPIICSNIYPMGFSGGASSGTQSASFCQNLPETEGLGFTPEEMTTPVETPGAPGGERSTAEGISNNQP